MLNFNSAPLNFIYNWKNCNKPCCAQQIQVRYLFRNFQRRGAFIAAFPLRNERLLSKTVHCTIGNRFQIFSSRLCQSFYDEKCKRKATAGAVCLIRILMANHCTRCRWIRAVGWGKGGFFFLINIYRINVISSGSSLLDSTFIWPNTLKSNKAHLLYDV